MAQNIPVQWNEILAGYVWTAQTLGQSDAAVFRLDRQGEPALFAKGEAVSAFADLPAEAARLRWLAAQDFPCPRILAEVEEGGWHWLLLSAVEGRDLTSSPDLAPGQVIEIAAEALRQLHGLDADKCPFDHGLDHQLALARQRVEAGLVDEEDFDETRLGQSATELFDELVRLRPRDEDRVVCHGDATFANLMARDARFTGVIDCTRLGVADRHQDLALVIRDIEENLGTEWTAPFLRLYGHDADPERIAFFQLLDEFF